MSKDFCLIRSINDALTFKQSTDVIIEGDRGTGKSTVGLSICLMGDRNGFDESKIIYTKDELINAINNSKDGDFLLLDEAGGEGSGLSSRSAMSGENKETSSLIRLIRSKKICLVYISPDRSWIDNRVRDFARYDLRPISKLTNEETNGNGLAILTELKQVVFGDEKKYVHPENVKHVIFPVPPKCLLDKYDKKRDAYLQSHIAK